MPTFAAAALGSLCSMRWEPSVIVSAEAVSGSVCQSLLEGHVMPARVPATPNVDSLWAGGLRNPAITDGDLPDNAAQMEIERSLNSFRQTDRVPVGIEIRGPHRVDTVGPMSKQLG
ncbi:hypothetical protein DFH09DRAFT_1110474 [Mycena vulgaris]|nr:hypothetical protein DFH09DRAFT_1110474 [Mycena vulgaris]